MKTMYIRYDGWTPSVLGDAVSGQVNTLRCSFAFSADWDAYKNRKAIFETDDAKKEESLDENGVCLIPRAVLMKRGKLKISAYGTETGENGELLRYNGRPAEIIVDLGGNVEGEITDDPVYPQIGEAVLYTAQSLTDAQKAQARANIGAGTPYTLPEASPDALGGVKADAAETADTQPVRIGTDGKLYTAQGGSGEAVLYTAQSLTDEQQAQARANIGAGTPYTLPEASSDALGGIKADAAETADTQPVRKGTDGKLYTAPTGNAVLYTAQSLTEEQQAQARANIGAGTPYTLPEASSDALGGIKADAAETADTQPVRIGEDGKLYTAPGSGGGADISLGISGASAGQMAKVKAVDENGAPTAWEAGDAAGGYSGYGNRNPDYTYTVTEVISELYISEINGNTFSANKLACLVEFPAGTGGFYYHALYTLQGSKDKNYCISNHNAPKLSNISTKDSVVFFIVEKLNNQNYKYNYSGQCKAREQLLDGSNGTYAAGIFPNSIEGETSIKSILLKGENAFGVGVKISIWLN